MTEGKSVVRDDPVAAVKLIAWDEAAAQAISRYRTKRGSLVIKGKVVLEPVDGNNGNPPRLRVITDDVIFLEEHAARLLRPE